MNLRNGLRAFGMTMAAGVVVLTATPAAIAGTTAPAQAAGKAGTTADVAKRHDAARSNLLPDWPFDGEPCGDVMIRSRANNQFVSAEVGYTGNVSGMLRARSGGAGHWERFSLCSRDGFDTLYSYGAMNYVSAELYHTNADYGMLRARSNSVGPWEKFDITCGKSDCTIRSLANGKYVGAELYYPGTNYGMLRARSDSAGPWEKFSISVF
ncbi:hypothetical protein [Streptosporangium sp. NPDC048865]|uniref:fascin domain-containing protein n=1 Tax=Streptosporangium sp. NPDC048865 TaxID=3155766 RepID=UPI0034399077